MAYGGGTVPAVEALWEWWLFTNFIVWHGLVIVVVAFVLASVSSKRNHDVIVQGESLSIMGYLLPCSWPRRPDFLWPD